MCYLMNRKDMNKNHNRNHNHRPVNDEFIVTHKMHGNWLTVDGSGCLMFQTKDSIENCILLHGPNWLDRWRRHLLSNWIPSANECPIEWQSYWNIDENITDKSLLSGFFLYPLFGFIIFATSTLTMAIYPSVVWLIVDAERGKKRETKQSNKSRKR